MGLPYSTGVPGSGSTAVDNRQQSSHFAISGQHVPLVATPLTSCTAVGDSPWELRQAVHLSASFLSNTEQLSATSPPPLHGHTEPEGQDDEEGVKARGTDPCSWETSCCLFKPWVCKLSRLTDGKYLPSVGPDFAFPGTWFEE